MDSKYTYRVSDFNGNWVILDEYGEEIADVLREHATEETAALLAMAPELQEVLGYWLQAIEDKVDAIEVDLDLGLGNYTKEDLTVAKEWLARAEAVAGLQTGAC